MSLTLNLVASRETKNAKEHGKTMGIGCVDASNDKGSSKALPLSSPNPEPYPSFPAHHKQDVACDSQEVVTAAGSHSKCQELLC